MNKHNKTKTTKQGKIWGCSCKRKLQDRYVSLVFDYLWQKLSAIVYGGEMILFFRHK